MCVVCPSVNIEGENQRASIVSPFVGYEILQQAKTGNILTSGINIPQVLKLKSACSRFEYSIADSASSQIGGRPIL